MSDAWEDRRVNIGYETAEELARHYNPLNWRAHPESQREATEESLDALGYVGAIKKSLQSGVVLDGHLRIELALAKDPAIRLPVDYYDLSPDEEALALQVLDATTEMAEPIADKLAALMERTRAMTADRPGLGAMLDRLKLRAGMNGNGHAPEPLPPPIDKAEELQAKWQVKPDDIWQIGQHFVICGDCREPETWQRLMDAAGVDKINGVFTSPPYAEQRKAQYGGVPTAEYVEWWGAVQTNVRAAMAEDGSFFVNIKPHCEDGQRVLYVFDLALAMVRRWGWRFVDELCWKNSGTPKKVDRRFKNQFEPVYQFCLSPDFKFSPESVLIPTNRAFKGDGRTLSKHQGVGESISAVIQPHDGLAYPGNVVDVNFETATGHQAAFPVALPTFFLKAYSDPGDVWLDPFCGSGTTLVASHNEGRIGLGIERLEKYVAVICERLQAMGLEPRLISG